MSLFKTPWLRVTAPRHATAQHVTRHARTARRVALLTLIDAQPETSLTLQAPVLQAVLPPTPMNRAAA